MISITEIREAAARLRGSIRRTPLLPADSLRGGLFLKAELFQTTGSFKVRGALNKVLQLSEAERAKGLVTVSAGNHALAVAWAASRVKVPCAVVMPSDAPRTKLEGVRALGAEVVLHPDRPTLFDRLRQVQQERGMIFVHPFDDPAILAGAGTQGLEILEDFPEVDVIVVPVGGGGTLGGLAVAVKALKPAIQVVAVELEAGPGLGPALAAGKPVPVARPAGTLADGMTPPFVAALTLEIARTKVDRIVTVTEDEIKEGMRALFLKAKLVAEGSGAAATAAVLAGKVPAPRGAKIVALVSGGNVDPERLLSLFT